MKKIFKILITAFLTLGLGLSGVLPCFAIGGKTFESRHDNILNVKNSTISGVFETVTDGYIVIIKHGVRQSYSRIDSIEDPYPDYITYRVKPYSIRTKSVPCKIIFLDKWTVRFKTPYSESMILPRYRATDIEINIK